jgi:hypothetical protein
MRADFPDFLLAAQSQAFPDCDGIVSPVFDPDPNHKQATDTDLDNAEQRLRVKLPASYRTFLRTLGSGGWCGDNIAVPQYLQAFDSSLWGCGGFVPLVDNVRGVGDTLCINPADTESDGERPVYYCAHDPFGQAWVAHSFEDWCRATVAAERDQCDYYELFSTQIYASWRAYKRARPWWKFWL